MTVPQEHAPVATLLSDPPSGSWMSIDQWESFFALADGCLPSITSTALSSDPSKLALPEAEYDRVVEQISNFFVESLSKPDIQAYLDSRPTDDENFRIDCLRTLTKAPRREELAQVMRLLGTRLGSLILTGYWTPIAQQPTKTREAIFKSWATSNITSLRMLAKSIAAAAQKAYGVSSPHFGSLSGYTNAPKNWKAVPGYDFRFMQIEPGSGVHEITTDVVIVGSGCGGGVSAKNVAEAGHRVLVVDKGYYFPPSQLPMPQDAACENLFDNGDIFLSNDASTTVVAGSSWGSGGIINWSVCFRLEDYVREEWADTGLPFFTSPEFDDCMDRVWKNVGAEASGIRHNHRNRVILEGADKLRWSARAVEQNTAGREHYCGQCHLGCGSAEKRGPTVAWLPAAADAGAQFLEGFKVDKITFAADQITATGVEGTWTARDAQGQVHTPASSRTQRRVRIRAKKVIVSCGSIRSPVLLANSGLKNWNLGRNLHLHPCNFVSAAYKEDTRPWEGGIITAYSGEFENLDGKGHGVKLEPAVMVPYAALSMQPWHDSLDAKLLALPLHQMATLIDITRDRDGGRVFPDPRTGEPRIEYTVSDFDRDHTLEGVEALAKPFYVTGTTEIRAHLAGAPPFVPADGGDRQRRHLIGRDPEFTDPAFAAWLRRLRRAGNKPPNAVWTSAHQMGSCRMSPDPSSGVVDPHGSVWGARNLYVADASVFPSASGVNPMVTAMSLVDWISRAVVQDLTKG